MSYRLATALTTSLLLLAACGQNPTAPLTPQSVTEDRSAWPSLEEGEAPLPDIGIDEGVFQNTPGSDNTDTTLNALALPTNAAPTYLTCRNEPSGPYLRLQTDPARTGAINFVEGSAYLPPVKAIPTAFPYVYLGGQPQTGVAADAGVYVNYDGSWIPFVAVAGTGGARNLPRDTGSEPGKTFVYRLEGDQKVQMRMYVQNDNELRLDITASDWVKFELKGTALTRIGSVGGGTRTIVHPLAPGWQKSGETQVYKVMTTIAFPGKGNFRYLTQNYDFLGSSWSGLNVGQTDTPGGHEWRVPFTRARLYSACAAPRDVVTPTKTALLPRASAEIRLRRLASVAFPGGTTFDLSTRLRQTERGQVSLQNTAAAPALVHYQADPLGRENTVKTLAGILGSGETATLPYSAICGTVPGTSAQSFNVLYAKGETVLGSNATSTAPAVITTPSTMPGAQPGDLLYHAAPVTVNLTCTGK